MTRYLLGLHPRFDLSAAVFDFRLEPGSLSHAAGRIPHPEGGWIDISWKTEAAGPVIRISTPSPLQLRFPNGETREVADAASFAIGSKRSTAGQ
jgi:hypothetical protein